MSFLKKLLGLFLGSPNRVSPRTRGLIERDWQNIERLIKGKSSSQLQKALLTADKALDNALRDLVPGNTMGERLKGSKDLFSSWESYQKIWKAHKMRNSMVHESGFEPPYYVVVEAIENLRLGLSDLGINV